MLQFSAIGARAANVVAGLVVQRGGMGVPPMSSMGILPMSVTGVSPVGLPSHSTAGTALRLAGKPLGPPSGMPVPRRIGLVAARVGQPPAWGPFGQAGRHGGMVCIYHHRGSQVLVGDVLLRVGGRAVGGDVRHPAKRHEGVGILIVVVYLPPAGKGNFFQPGVRGRAARQAVAPRVGHVGVCVGRYGDNGSRTRFSRFSPLVVGCEVGGAIFAAVTPIWMRSDLSA